MATYKGSGKRGMAGVQAISIRFPVVLADALRGYAERDHRSLNGQVLAVLEAYVREQEQREEVKL